MVSIDFDYPDQARVLGLSVSHWSGIVDWNIARNNGIRFAYIKAMNGINGPVQFWRENYEGAKAAGIKVGHYTWLYPSSVASAGGQARAFAAFCNAYPSDLPPCVDFEWTSPSNPTVGDLYGFVLPFEAGYHSKPAIYTAPGYWAEYGSKNQMWANYPLWQAQYNNGDWNPIAPWVKYEFLQWTEKGKGTDYGVPVTGERACELNYYWGTLDEFTAKYGQLTYEPPPIEGGEPPSTGEIMSTQKGVAKVATNIKTMDGMPTGAVATLPVGGWVFGDYNSTKSDLINVTAWYRASGEQVLLAEPCKVSVTNLTVTPFTEPPPDPDPDPDPTPDDDSLIVTASIVNGKAHIVVTGAGGVADVIVDGVEYVKAS